ncbi:aldolase [Methanimicrococcus blatticola]|uniref:L-fuculose-phosphate aldolase n=1 Tax=Methanimicrococcus blatticola TaxID=91560 RepID=A0A484F6Q5_9EURY|nr:aldolase [Methanimicrococcus blatticola]MBZ3936320.1 aldolase [Methanimicrococcus blatticola]MCC2508324.1 aldolase [Methanimicrococcus blatticola]TDQ70222.1 L-fuculose-phosphate aldolase [Methanimicrococcus blatticola]
MWQKISATGKKVVQSGLVEANFGNISVRSASGNSFIITKTGAALDEIGVNSVIEVPIYNGEEDTLTEAGVLAAIEKAASSETPVHRRIYSETKAKVILHAHCPYSVVMSILEHEAGNETIVPIDSEGKLFLKEIPIIEGGIGSDELAKNAAAAFKDGKTKSVVVLGHGTIAIGETLEEAYNITAQLEHAAKIKYMYATAKNLF